MSKGTKIALIIGGVLVVGVGGYFIYKNYFQNGGSGSLGTKKRVQEGTVQKLYEDLNK